MRWEAEKDGGVSVRNVQIDAFRLCVMYGGVRLSMWKEIFRAYVMNESICLCMYVSREQRLFQVVYDVWVYMFMHVCIACAEIFRVYVMYVCMYFCVYVSRE